MMKKIHDFNPRNLLRLWAKIPCIGLIPGIVLLCSFVLSVIAAIASMNLGITGPGDLQDFEVGRVADREVIADYSLSYIDENATRLRMDAQEHLVPAVFRFSTLAAHEVRNQWNNFCNFTDIHAKEDSSQASMLLAVQAEYPGQFSVFILSAYFSDPDRPLYREYGYKILDSILEKGIFALSEEDLGKYNPDKIELLVPRGDRTERERIDFDNLITLNNIELFVQSLTDDSNFPPDFRKLALPLLNPFIRENVFFSPEDTAQRINEAREKTSPVIKTIEKGKRIIRKGFVITADNMTELHALSAVLHKRDPRFIIGQLLLLVFLYSMFYFLQGKQILGKEISAGESSLLFALVCLNLAGAALVKNLVAPLNNFPVSLFFPSALLVMISSVFMGPLLALIIAITFPLSACLAGFFDIPSCIFALISGAAASIILKDAEKRMDLIKAGLAIAAANCFAVIVISLLSSAGFAEYPPMLFWAALNGIISGMLTLGILPPLEHALNASTTFRLIELSDLNAPILRKLFTTAPGTYSHSIMVANLAEQACQDIGANALLARVGAYYHDIGKMDNPDYFVENQTDYNKHDDMAPRLSATVIRSHVKLGVEKARQLGLPAEVINIVAEHHGNSLITWFYNKASKQEDQVNTEDFAYPGSPPRTRESAVVMLADVTEAAVRTLIKPTAAKMEKFIQQLFDARVGHGQLAQSELTFRDLQTIKNAFIKVLAGYYHSRIEYPKEPE